MKALIAKTMARTFLILWALIGAAAIQAQTADLKFTLMAATPVKTWQVDLQQTNAGEPKFRLQFINHTAEKVTLLIEDKLGANLYSKTINSAQFAKTFDLSTLQDGVYTFVLSKGKEVVRKTVYLNTDLVVVKKAYIK